MTLNGRPCISVLWGNLMMASEIMRLESQVADLRVCPFREFRRPPVSAVLELDSEVSLFLGGLGWGLCADLR